jgi:DNA-binding SARP family transcriptional activator
VLSFSILGPVEARHGDRCLALGGPRPRALLATLLLNANQVVPISQLVEMLWGDRPPGEGKGTVQGYVCRLRRVFSSAMHGGDQHRVITRAPGYLLAADPQELDLLRFEQLVARARRAATTQRYQTAVDLLDEALALWRGPAMADVTADTGLAAAAHRLEENRLAATEQKVAAELMLGRHELVIGPLRDLMNAWPTREGFVEQLMTALCRCDRRAEALDVYRRARQQLVAQLGVEPGPSLRQLERRILSADPSLHCPGDGGRDARIDLSVLPRVRRRGRGTEPRQLPGDITTFVGRDAELDRVHAALSVGTADAPVVCAVNGVAGVGKSTLVIRAAHRVAHRFPDGQLYVDLQGGRRCPPATVSVLGRLIRALGSPSRPVRPGADSIVDPDVAEATASYRSLLADRRVLVVLDGASSAGQVYPLLPGGAGSAVLVTSRRVLAGLDTAHHLHLDVLSRHAVALLAARVGHRRVQAEQAAAALIVRRCDYLPLAVRIIGARLADRPGWSLAEVAEHLADERTRLDMLRWGELSVAAGIRASHDTLCAEDGIAAPAPRAFRLLGLPGLPGFPDGAGIGVGLVAALLDQPPDTALRALEALVDLRLLHANAFGHYRMADLVRLVARQCAAEHEPDAGQVAALGRAARCCPVPRPGPVPVPPL